MAKLSVLTWIGNAAAVLCGRHGAITAQVEQAGCSRQAAYEHARRVRQAVTDAHAGGPLREQLLQELEQVRAENHGGNSILSAPFVVRKLRQNRHLNQACSDRGNAAPFLAVGKLRPQGGCAWFDTDPSFRRVDCCCGGDGKFVPGPSCWPDHLNRAPLHARYGPIADSGPIAGLAGGRRLQ